MARAIYVPEDKQWTWIKCKTIYSIFNSFQYSVLFVFAILICYWMTILFKDWRKKNICNLYANQEKKIRKCCWHTIALLIYFWIGIFEKKSNKTSKWNEEEIHWKLSCWLCKLKTSNHDINRNWRILYFAQRFFDDVIKSFTCMEFTIQ